jgi:hypothetical protein
LVSWPQRVAKSLRIELNTSILIENALAHEKPAPARRGFETARAMAVAQYR